MKIGDQQTLIRLAGIFIVSFVLNFVWEHMHSVLYVHYKGGPITDFILFRATLGDALFITAMSIPFFRISVLRQNLWLYIPLAIACAAFLELFALSTGRWEYTDLMPLVPFIKTGLSPTLQLGILGYLTFLAAKKYTP